MPCPWCGPGRSVCDPVYSFMSKRWQVFCGACGASCGSYPTEAEAIAAWNRRAASAESARMREALDKIACWDEGPKVTGSFDEPGAAQIARAALAPRERQEPRA